ncbi:MAG: O-antigen ligase family protein [Lentisphaeria bacterium]|nr:O-antigen ligase family protein [Lentisphaeria bacterium]
MTEAAGPELAQTESCRPDSERFSLLVAALFLCCALLWNPQALFQPGKTGNLPLFTPNALAFLAAGLVFCAPKFPALRKFMLVAAGGFAVLLTGQFIRHYPGCWIFVQFGDGLWWIALPALAYVYAPAFRKLLPIYVLAVGGYAFLHSVWADLLGKWSAGITGNENWTAALFVMTMIFLGAALYDRLQKTDRPRKKLLILIFGIILELLLLHRIWKIGSKGALLALLLATVGFFWLRCSSMIRRIILGIGLIGLLAGAVWLTRNTDAASRFITDDGRVIFWENAVSLIADHPLFGVGQGSYENHYMTYRDTDYFWLKNPAARSNHPHSHLLYMAGSWGLCGLILWGVLLFAPLAMTIRKLSRHETVDPLETACFLTLVCAILHGSLDIIMITLPTGTIALLCLGLLARNLTAPARPPIEAPRKILLIPAGAMILFAAVIAGRSVYAEMQVRRAWRGELSPEEIL